MVLISRSSDIEDTMPQIVPSARFTPSCDYTNFAENFDLSLLPDEEFSHYNILYAQSPPPAVVPEEKPLLQLTYSYIYDEGLGKVNDEPGPDFQKLLPEAAESNLYPSSPYRDVYLEAPSSKKYHANSPIGTLSPYSPQGLLTPNEQFNVYHDQQTFHPNSPDVSLHNSPSPCYRDDFVYNQYVKKENQSKDSYSTFQVKEENYLIPCNTNSEYTKQSPAHTAVVQQIDNANVFELLKSTLLEKQVKQESTVDFSNILEEVTTNRLTDCNNYKNFDVISHSSSKDHQLLREVLRDTSFQKKYNIKPIDFGFISSYIKMDESEETTHKDLISTVQLNTKNMEPVIDLAIQQVRKVADSTCTALNISSDASQWTSANVWSWLQWTCREFNLPVLIPEQWDITGAVLVSMTEADFIKRAPDGGSTIYAQLEIWKAACMAADMVLQWMPETCSNTSSGCGASDGEEEECSAPSLEIKPSTSRTTGGSHIHLWQFLKELLASPQIHGSCIRWLDRSNGIFKIEDSVKVAKLWGKRKNRPAMNYDKLSRSIRQYYKKGIMKKTERSQRLVYQFCHPYCL